MFHQRKQRERLWEALQSDPSRFEQLLVLVQARCNLTVLHDELVPFLKWPTLPTALLRRVWSFLDVLEDVFVNVPVVCRHWNSLLSNLSTALPWNEIVVDFHGEFKGFGLGHPRLGQLDPLPYQHVSRVPVTPWPRPLARVQTIRCAGWISGDLAGIMRCTPPLRTIQGVVPFFHVSVGSRELIEGTRLIDDDDCRKWKEEHPHCPQIKRLEILADVSTESVIHIPSTVRDLHWNCYHDNCPQLMFDSPERVQHLGLGPMAADNSAVCGFFLSLGERLRCLRALKSIHFWSKQWQPAVFPDPLPLLTHLLIHVIQAGSFPSLPEFPRLYSLELRVEESYGLPVFGETLSVPSVRLLCLKFNKTFDDVCPEHFLTDVLTHFPRVERIELTATFMGAGPPKDRWHQAWARARSRTTRAIDMSLTLGV